MDENIISILKNFGWTEGFRVPIANEENKTLESKAEKIYEKRVQLTSHLKECQDRLNLVKYYSNNVVEERKQYQEIHSTCKEQQVVETLLRKKITTERKIIRNGRIEITKKKKQLFEDNADLKLECDRMHREITRLKNILDWGKELESIWIEYTNSEYERVNLLEKLHLKNDTKLERIEVKRLNLCGERDEYDAILQQKYQNVLETECSLNKLVKLQLKLRKERNQSIDKWEWLIRVITSRDHEVIRLSEEMNMLAEMSTNLKNKITEKKHFYHEQTRCNIRADIDIRREEIEFSNQTSLRENLNSQLEQLESKIVDYRRNLFSLNVEISKNRASVARTNKVIGHEANAVREMTSRNERAIKKRLQTKVLCSSVEERTKELAHILQDEKIKLNGLQSNCKKFEIRLQKQNFSLADSERLLSAYDCEIEELKHANVRLDTDNQRCKQQIEKQMDIVSDLNEKLIELVKHTQYVKGDKINQMANEQKKYLTNISAYCNYQEKILEQLNKDCQHFQCETTLLEKTIAHYAQQMNVLQSEKEKLLLLMDGYEQRLNATTERNQQKLVSENVTRTKVDYLENALAKSTDKMLNLKKQKVEIDVLFRKHNFEMRATWNILRNRKKLINQEISNIKYPIEQIKRRICQQMKRYEIITDGMKKDDNGIPLNVTNYKIQMTKERYALLEKGDELDVSVRKAEKEIQAMENTLTLLNASNNVCKRNSSTATGNENASQVFKYEEKKRQKLKLSTTHKKIDVIARKTKNEISRHQVALSMELLPKIDQLEKSKEKKEADYAQMCRAANAQLSKMDRVEARIKRTEKTFKTSRTDARILEREFISKQMFELNRCVLRRITRLINQHAELSTPVHQYLTTKGISLPRTR